MVHVKQKPQAPSPPLPYPSQTQGINISAGRTPTWFPSTPGEICIYLSQRTTAQEKGGKKEIGLLASSPELTHIYVYTHSLPLFVSPPVFPHSTRAEIEMS